ncbi:response regulator transcription factor [Halobaculum sp. MBLA0147]|uniref:response regulator transcription factor n=1 Tax=Halobaculum sp. MBLA0147 TaxID=3079934 RepID=UPI00352629A9
MESTEQSATVLVVDDETDLTALYATWLESEYEVVTATSGEEALERVDGDVDVALLDRRMPDLSGDEVLAEIRRRSVGAQVAMLTAVEPDTDIAEMQFDDYVTKPVEREEVHAVVEVLLERRTYDRKSREFFALASKKAALESANEHDSEEYEALVERMAEIRREMDRTLDTLTAEEAFAQLDSDGEFDFEDEF